MFSTILFVFFLPPQSIAQSGIDSGCTDIDELKINYQYFSVDQRRKFFTISIPDSLISSEKLHLNIFSDCNLKKPDYQEYSRKHWFHISFKHFVKEHSCFSITYGNLFPGECSSLRYSLFHLTKPDAIYNIHLIPEGEACIPIPNVTVQFVFPAKGEFNDDCVCATNELFSETCQCLNNTGYSITFNATFVCLNETKEYLNDTSMYIQKVEKCTNADCKIITILKDYNFQIPRKFSFKYNECLFLLQTAYIVWERATDCGGEVLYYLVKGQGNQNRRLLNNQTYASIPRNEMNGTRLYVEASVGGTICTITETSLVIPDTVETRNNTVKKNEDKCISPNSTSSRIILPKYDNDEETGACICDDILDIDNCGCIISITTYRIYNENGTLCFGNVRNDTIIHIVTQTLNENPPSGTYPQFIEIFLESYRFLVVDPDITENEGLITTENEELITIKIDNHTNIMEQTTIADFRVPSKTPSDDITTSSSTILLPTPEVITAGVFFCKFVALILNYTRKSHIFFHM